MRDRVEETGIGQVIFILDACRNEPGAGRSGTDNPLSEGFVRQFSFDSRNRDVSAFVILYASEIGHRAYEYIEKKQGYFSWFLVEALRGATANDRGEVTLGAVRTFTEAGGKTILTMVTRYDSKAIRDSVLKSGMEDGVAVSFDILDGILVRAQG